MLGSLPVRRGLDQIAGQREAEHHEPRGWPFQDIQQQSRVIGKAALGVLEFGMQPLDQTIEQRQERPRYDKPEQDGKGAPVRLNQRGADQRGLVLSGLDRARRGRQLGRPGRRLHMLFQPPVQALGREAIDQHQQGRQQFQRRRVCMAQIKRQPERQKRDR